MARKYITQAAVIKADPVRNVRYFNLYVVVDREGELRQVGDRVAVYKAYTRACKAAKEEGDSVIEVEVNLSKAPMFIHRKTV